MARLVQIDPDEAARVSKEAVDAMVPFSVILDQHKDVMPDENPKIKYTVVKKYIRSRKKNKKKSKKRSKRKLKYSYK